MEDQELEYAGFWKRFWAYLLDILILSIPVIIISIILVSTAIYNSIDSIDYSAIPQDATQAEIHAIFQERTAQSMENAGFGVFRDNLIPVMAAWSLITILFFATLTAGKKQATWGKRALKIYVVKKTPNGFEKPSFLTCFGRHGLPLLLSLIINYAFRDMEELMDPAIDARDMLGWVFWVVWYLVMLFTAEKTTIHDMLFKTRVVLGKVN